MQDTIYALATGSLGCAVAIVRVSGPHAASIGERFSGYRLRPREIRFSHISDPVDGELIDSGLVVFFEAPSSFTGEDCLEFQIHGSRAVVARLIESLEREPETRIARPGEFIKRAFDNGKLALTSVEGVADLIDAKTDLQRRQALAQASGALGRHAIAWRDMILEALALVTAEIDFADEGEAPSEVLGEVRAILRRLCGEFDQALAAAKRGEVIRSGFRVVLCGAPNAGKSSLLNALAQRDVAIVTEHAGTTRDMIEVELDLGGVPVTLCDTAGLREASDAVEALGVERSRKAIESADLTVWLADSREETPAIETGHGASLVVASKLDLSGAKPVWCDLALSVRSGVGVDALIASISKAASAAAGGESVLVTNARQRNCVEAAARHARRLMADDLTALELVADELLRCADALEGLVGRIGTEDVLGSVFSRFCMGK